MADGSEVVTSVDFSKRPFTVNIDGGATVVNAATVIICTGATAKYTSEPVSPSVWVLYSTSMLGQSATRCCMYLEALSTWWSHSCKCRHSDYMYRRHG